MPRVLWCWRCQADVPMLEEEEWRAYAAALARGEARAPRGNLALERETETQWRARFEEALGEYNRITGFGETNINAASHHRVSLLGPPCDKCGKPLRTPRATLCAACGERRRAT